MAQQLKSSTDESLHKLTSEERKLLYSDVLKAHHEPSDGELFDDDIIRTNDNGERKQQLLMVTRRALYILRYFDHDADKACAYRTPLYAIRGITQCTASKAGIVCEFWFRTLIKDTATTLIQNITQIVCEFHSVSVESFANEKKRQLLREFTIETLFEQYITLESERRDLIIRGISKVYQSEGGGLDITLKYRRTFPLIKLGASEYVAREESIRKQLKEADSEEEDRLLSEDVAFIHELDSNFELVPHPPCELFSLLRSTISTPEPVESREDTPEPERTSFPIYRRPSDDTSDDEQN